MTFGAGNGSGKMSCPGNPTAFGFWKCSSIVLIWLLNEINNRVLFTSDAGPLVVLPSVVTNVDSPVTGVVSTVGSNEPGEVSSRTLPSSEFVGALVAATTSAVRSLESVVVVSTLGRVVSDGSDSSMSASTAIKQVHYLAHIAYNSTFVEHKFASI